MEWRRHPDQGWQALLATPGGRGGGALIQWRSAGAMRPLTDDGLDATIAAMTPSW